ncbi:MAG: NUDIX domain-containing protein [Anaerolineales bacterium]
MKPRAAIILILRNEIALIERYRAGKHYFVFPGGKIKAHETPAITAKREALEELGLVLSIGSMVAEVWYMGSPQYYFLAEQVSGHFGHGTGSEMDSQPESEKGSHLPVWMPVDELPDRPVLPKIMAEYVWKSHQTGWPEHPLLITDPPPDEPV